MTYNAISSDRLSDKHYKFSGFSSTITDSYSTPSTGPNDLSWDGFHVLSADTVSDKIYKHNGFSSTILDSFAGPSSDPIGVSWYHDSSLHLISSDGNADRIYKHDGFSTTILSSFGYYTANPTGISSIGVHLTTSDELNDKHCRHSGFSSSITASYGAPGTVPIGMSWTGDNVLSTDYGADRHYKHQGFSSTILQSYASPSTSPTGIGWDGRFEVHDKDLLDSGTFAELALNSREHVVYDELSLSVSHIDLSQTALLSETLGSVDLPILTGILSVSDIALSVDLGGRDMSVFIPETLVCLVKIVRKFISLVIKEEEEEEEPEEGIVRTIPRLNVNESLGLPQKVSYTKDKEEYEILLRWSTVTDPDGLIITVSRGGNIIAIKRVPAVTGMDVRDPVSGVLLFMMFAYTLPGYVGSLPIATSYKYNIGIW